MLMNLKKNKQKRFQVHSKIYPLILALGKHVSEQKILVMTFPRDMNDDFEGLREEKIILPMAKNRISIFF